MTEKFLDEILLEPELEPERYELAAGPAYRFEIGRRDFFKGLGGGVLIVFALAETHAQQESGGSRRGGGRPIPQEISAWLHIGEDGATPRIPQQASLISGTSAAESIDGNRTR